MNKLTTSLISILAFGMSMQSEAARVVNWSQQSPAEMHASVIANPETAPILSATCLGDRVIAVGEYGSVVTLNHATDKVKQANVVPTKATLTSVYFTDQTHGWAVGHQGVVLRTRDGGENWSRLLADAELEALFSVYFENEQHGFAGGRFATLIETQDGGDSWQKVDVLNDPDADEVHLFDLFSDGAGRIYATSEFGQVFYRAQQGYVWQTLNTGFAGSIWGGIASPDGVVIVVGMVGTIYRSDDFGQSWQQISSDSKSSFTDIARMKDGSIIAVGINGTVATSQDNGKSFKVEQRNDRASLTSVSCGSNALPALFAKGGYLRK